MISAGLTKIAIDPIDNNYMELAFPGEGSPLIVPTAPIWSDLFSALNDLSGLPDAVINSFNRADGAFAASADQFWVDLQTEAATKYFQLIEDDVGRIEVAANILGLNTTVPTAVPEPSTWAMMLLGFAGLGFAGWRGRRKTAGAVA